MTPAQAKGGAMSGRGWQAMVTLLAVVALILSGCASQSGSAQAGVSSESAYGGSGGAAMGMGPDSRSGRGGPGMGRGPSPREFVAAVGVKGIHFAFDRAEIGSGGATGVGNKWQGVQRKPHHLGLIRGRPHAPGRGGYN